MQFMRYAFPMRSLSSLSTSSKSCPTRHIFFILFWMSFCLYRRSRRQVLMMMPRTVIMNATLSRMNFSSIGVV
jgi:hypothetical protein